MNSTRKILFLTVVIGLVFSSSLAAAGEVVRFQDGRYLKVEGHEVRGDAVKLIMANRSILVLPRERIDSIRSGRVVVYSASGTPGIPAQDIQAVARDLREEFPEPVTGKRG